MGRKVGLTVDDVVDAAVQVADAEGLEAVTLATVAGRLGIRPPSLYAHVAGLDGLRRLLALRAAEAMADALQAAAGERAGLEAVREIAVAYRRFARAHPGLYHAAQRAVRPGEDDALYRAQAAAAMPAFRALDAAGVAASEQVHLVRTFRAALHGFVTLEQSGGFGLPASVDESFEHCVELLLSGIRAAALRAAGA